MIRRSLLGLLVLATLLAPGASAQNADLHVIPWYVHVDMVTGSEPLSFWEDLIAQATADSGPLLQGNQGGTSFADPPCCSEITLASVSTYGSPGDGLDTPASSDIPTMRAAIAAGDPGGSVAFLVRNIDLCGGSTTAIGCGVRPSCNTNPNDDPDLWLMVSVEAMQDDDSDFVPEGPGDSGQTYLHERGHNSCLSHVTDSRCQVMYPSGDGGCFSATECVDFQEGRNTTTQGDACACHSGSSYVSDGNACSQGATSGQCSGGVCTASGGDVEVLAAVIPGSTAHLGPLPEPTDDFARMHSVPGGWSDEGDFAASVQGLAYDADRDVLWGVLDNGANDQIVQLDPATGALLSTLVTLTGHPNVISLAFHPGPTSAGTDDHLLANSAEPEIDCEFDASPTEFCSGDLLEIDPSDGSFAKVGDMSSSFVGGMTGMAWDVGNAVLYGSAFAGGSIWEFTNLSCAGSSCSCPSSFCTLAEKTEVDLTMVRSSLAYSPDSDRFYMLGSQSGPRAQFFSFDADSFAATPEINVYEITGGGLAARPLPEPAAAWVWGLGAVAALGARRRRGSR